MNIVCGVNVVVGNYQWLLSWLCYISIELQVCCINGRQPCAEVRSVMQSGDGEYQPEVLGVQSVVLHCGVVKHCCGSDVLPCRGSGALWNCALCCWVKSGAKLWCCKAVLWCCATL